MLSFNLSKSDRIVLHKRISSSSITPKELALMSSTDLANEETKQSIKILEKESLEHSILQKSTVPRAKITHKGLQDIEDVNGDVVMREREREREREKEEEERRERERQARLKAAEEQQKQRAAAQGSAPPESPIVPHTPSWGGPPPLPHPMHSVIQFASGNDRPPMHSLYASDFQSMLPEPELDIADLINLDDEPGPQDSEVEKLETPALATPELVADTTSATAPEPANAAESAPTTATEPTPATTTEPTPPPSPHSSLPAGQTATLTPATPLTPKPETPARTSFDLNALWSAPPAAPPPPASDPGVSKEPHMEVDVIAMETNDQDFDMFLEKDQDSESSQAEQPPQDPEITFNTLPLVWRGKVSVFIYCSS